MELPWYNALGERCYVVNTYGCQQVLSIHPFEYTRQLQQIYIVQ